MYKENPQLLKRWPTKQSNQLAAYAGLGLPGVGLGASDDRKNGCQSSLVIFRETRSGRRPASF